MPFVLPGILYLEVPTVERLWYVDVLTGRCW
jgi:hypothetical protein